MSNEQIDIDSLLLYVNDNVPVPVFVPYPSSNKENGQDNPDMSEFLTQNENSTSDSFYFKNTTKENKKKDIFKIIKQKKKYSEEKEKTKKHTKFSEDNIIRKIKRNFIDKCFNYINLTYINLKGRKLLYRISPKETIEISKEKNLKWFNLKLKDIFSYRLSNKCSTKEKDYNKKQIERIYNEGIQEMIIIFETKVKDMFNDYINDVKREGFDTLEDDVCMIKGKMEKEEDEKDIVKYINEYIKIAKGLEKNFEDKRARTKNNHNIGKEIQAIVI